EVNKYMFFETGATVITLVLLGNLIEQRSVRQTTSSITQLSKLQPTIAKKIISKNGLEEIVECNIEDLRTGEIVLVNTGDGVPTDGKIISGRAVVNESMLTGESLPVTKTIDDQVAGGTIIEEGNIRFVVEHTLKDNALSKI